MESCLVGDSIVNEAPCPDGTKGTGKALWSCTSLNPVQSLGVCECTLEVSAADMCKECNEAGAAAKNPENPCSPSTDEGFFLIETANHCSLQKASQKTSLACPPGTTKAGQILPFEGKWRCYSGE